MSSSLFDLIAEEAEESFERHVEKCWKQHEINNRPLNLELKKGRLVFVGQSMTAKALVKLRLASDSRFTPTWRHMNSAMIFFGYVMKRDSFNVAVCKAFDTAELVEVPAVFLTCVEPNDSRPAGEFTSVLANLKTEQYNGRLAAMVDLLGNNRFKVKIMVEGKARMISVPSSNIYRLSRMDAYCTEMYTARILQLMPCLKCPLTHDVLKRPVVAPDGITYSALELLQWFRTLAEKHNVVVENFADAAKYISLLRSPLTNTEFKPGCVTFAKNLNIDSLIDSLENPYYNSIGQLIASHVRY